MISFDDVQKVEIRAGKVLAAETVEGSEKLLRLTVYFGEEMGERQVLSGIAKHVSPEEITEKTFLFVTNLEPRSIMGFESQAMILALGEEETFSLVRSTKEVAPGSQVR